MNRRPPKEKLIYVSPFWGMHSSFLSFIFEISWKRRCASYPLRLWTTRGIGSCSGLIRTFKLHAECAVPRYFPLMWQWPLTASLTLERWNGLTQYGQSSWLFLIHLFTFWVVYVDIWAQLICLQNSTFCAPTGSILSYWGRKQTLKQKGFNHRGISTNVTMGCFVEIFPIALPHCYGNYFLSCFDFFLLLQNRL